ncbi:uncharacterized protein BO88DRAFT_250574 [Aspergillus vadensis CBS 113365]|uniref:Uncharacterized protein n=1 Tax=Aspergillus vadensis (strain CBS 113365 / IMI 142717 / IBT 24658) TaxID=1448311 RepID=A0A319BEM0_ASPVC|nr:hypothetical protein BO88DRAFT_250574 [Aspergillus vadensis CBS 113365]PYH70561.1 hypothetical protein BO88DRAFT_250574 [Aspergillus vadensis CBS 113365]
MRALSAWKAREKRPKTKQSKAKQSKQAATQHTIIASPATLLSSPLSPSLSLSLSSRPFSPPPSPTLLIFPFLSFLPRSFSSSSLVLFNFNPP